MEWFNSLGLFFAMAGAALATLMAGIGSAKGVGIVSEASAAVVIEEPSKFSRLLILQLLPGTQGLYGFVVAIMILINTGILGGNAAGITGAQGMAYLAASLPIAFGGMLSAIAQGRVAAAGVTIVAKNLAQSTKAIISATLVEFYALLSFIISFLIVISI